MTMAMQAADQFLDDAISEQAAHNSPIGNPQLLAVEGCQQ